MYSVTRYTLAPCSATRSRKHGVGETFAAGASPALVGKVVLLGVFARPDKTIRGWRTYLEFAVVDERSAPLLVRIFFSSQSLLERAFRVAKACFVGLWLGVLTRERMHAIDEEFYTRTRNRRDRPDYHDREYNRRGLWEWEEQALTEHFAECERLMLIGAGGGREVLALLRLGYCVDGFESHPALVAAANGLLREEGFDTSVGLVPRDESPKTNSTYDGIIVGWGAYMLVQSRRRRIALLEQLRARTQKAMPHPALLLLAIRHA